MTSRSEQLRRLVSKWAGRALPATVVAQFDLHELDSLEIPDSRTCREAERICRTACSESLSNHCFRTFAWGAVLGRIDALSWDAEVLYIASLFHDLGLVARYDRGGCFESDGADAAREILTGLGWEESRVVCVADAIYLHMHDVPAGAAVEAHLLSFGASADVTGRRMGEITGATRDFVLALAPRRAFKAELVGLFDDQVRRKPRCVVAELMNEGMRERILGAPFDE